MKFGRLVDPPERLTHTKFQLITIIIDGATAYVDPHMLYNSELNSS